MGRSAEVDQAKLIADEQNDYKARDIFRAFLVQLLQHPEVRFLFHHF